MFNWVLGKLFIGLEPGGVRNCAECLALNVSWDDIHNGENLTPTLEPGSLRDLSCRVPPAIRFIRQPSCSRWA